MFDRLIKSLSEAGYLGLAALMFLENVFPPIPSEIIMPAAGFRAGQGRLDLFGVIVAGAVGRPVRGQSGAMFGADAHTLPSPERGIPGEAAAATITRYS